MTERPRRKFKPKRKPGSRPYKSGSGQPNARRSGPPKPRLQKRDRQSFSSNIDSSKDETLHPQRTEGEASADQENNEESPDLLFGRHAVLAAIEEGRTLNRIWVTSHLRYNPKFHKRLDLAKGNGATITEVDMQRLTSMTQGGRHQGIVAQAAPYAYTDLGDMITAALASGRAPFLVIADGIQDPHNLGAIARSTEAMGGKGVIIPQRRAVGVTSTASKVAAGALETLPVARVVNLTQAIEQLKEAGFWIYGTVVGSEQSLYETKFDGPTAIAIGAEGKGLSLRVQQNCDVLVSIPTSGKVDSLNASVATGMILSEINRQRWQKTVKLPQVDKTS